MGLINSTFSMFIWILAVLLFLVGCSTYIHKPIKFDWNASESAPKLYPMRIISGALLTKDNYSQYIPSGGSIFFGWGPGWSAHVVGPDLKPLPDELSVTFYSYTEDQFYSDRFKLPYDKILSLFQNGYYSPKEKKDITYDSIVVGVAPGGVVSVWLDGIDRRTEIFSDTAKKMENDWALISTDSDISKEEYINMVVNDALETDEAIKSLKIKGVPLGLWSKYHKSRYYWKPKFAGIKLRDNFIQQIKYYNGEEGYLNYPLDEDESKKTRAIPKELIFVWSYNKDTNFNYELYFDEQEIFDAFEKLGNKNQPLELEMKLFEHDKGTRFSVELKNEEEGIFLKKFRLETYGAD